MNVRRNKQKGAAFFIVIAEEVAIIVRRQGSNFLRKEDEYFPECTASQSRRQVFTFTGVIT